MKDIRTMSDYRRAESSRRILSSAAIEALRATDPEAASQARWARADSPAARRLDNFKRKAAESIETIRKHRTPEAAAEFIAAGNWGDWRRERYPRRFHGGRWQEAAEARRPEERAFYVDKFDSDLGLRELGTAEEISKREGSRAVEHSGWYVREDDYSDTVSGYVLQLPARNGKPIYIPATARTDCEGVTLYPLDQYDEALEAARAADGIAEREAEESREYDSAWHAGSRYAEAGAELAAARKLIRQLSGELKPLAPPFRAAVQERLAQHRRAAERATKERAELKENAESAFSWNRDRRREIVNAFNEGAGRKVIRA